MKALLDEQLSPQIAALLRQAGCDVQAVADRDELVGCSDRTILEVARREGRAVVTSNIKDFRPLAAEWLGQGCTHAGLVLLPSARTRNRSAVAALAKAVEAVLREHPDGLDGGERWIGPFETACRSPGRRGRGAPRSARPPSAPRGGEPASSELL